MSAEFSTSAIVGIAIIKPSNQGWDGSNGFRADLTQCLRSVVSNLLVVEQFDQAWNGVLSVRTDPSQLDHGRVASWAMLVLSYLD